MKPDIPLEERDELIESIKGLKEKVPSVEDFEIGIDAGGKSNSYDFALNSTFRNMADLEAYAAHPDHVKVVERIRELCESHVKVDFVV